jgi:cag pathogenicity island protein 24
MKYKRLSSEELQALEPEFINFLATNSITAPDWVNLKETNMERVEELIELFSDMVYENILQKIAYLEYLSPRDLMIFHCKGESLHMVGIQLSDECGIDLTDEDFFDLWQSTEGIRGISVYSKEKKYNDERAVDVFQLIQSGCVITNEKLFNTILPLCTKG